MALIYCRECGKKYSSRAKKCPRCGYAPYDLSKSIWVYLLLCWLFGVFGAHRFYAGKKDSGVVMFILTITVVGSVITGIWALIDLIVGICNISTPNEIFEK